MARIPTEEQIDQMALVDIETFFSPLISYQAESIAKDLRNDHITITEGRTRIMRLVARMRFHPSVFDLRTHQDLYA